MKERWREGYKVVFVTRNRRLVSEMGPHIDGVVEYKVGKKTVPSSGCGPLCIYTTLRAAVLETFRFLYNWRDFKNTYAVYNCTYTPSRKKTVWLDKDWSKARLKDLSDGTALAEAVVLGTRVPDTEVERVFEHGFSMGE